MQCVIGEIMKKIVLILSFALSASAFANDTSKTSPQALIRGEYYNLQQVPLDPKQLIGMWKSIGGSDRWDSQEPSKLSFEFTVSKSDQSQVDITVYNGERFGYINNVSFEKFGTGNTLSGMAMNTMTPCEPDNDSGKCPKKYSKVRATWNYNHILAHDEKSDIYITLNDCVSVANIYLVCDTHAGSDMYEDIKEVFQREIPPTPSIISFEDYNEKN